jgi:hypothetical protein
LSPAEARNAVDLNVIAVGLTVIPMAWPLARA